jgi:hypothetical protein
MKIIHLKNETYQVVNETEESVLFQGTLTECQLYTMKDNPFLLEFLKLFKS